MYSNYQTFVNEIQTIAAFKSNNVYNSILEHVSYEQGNMYIFELQQCINTNFPTISFDNVNDFLTLNDKIGDPTKYNFVYDANKIHCSPTSIRYVLHSLLILKYINHCKLEKIVEVGCGYGGLFLAINHFSNILNIKINQYYFIDLPEITGLIEKYVNSHKSVINIKYSTHSSYNYGNDIKDDNLFFISNYCFTEIDEIHRDNYIKYLLPKTKNGFIIWQTIFNVPIHNVSTLKKQINYIYEETPQTATNEHKNYCVYF